MQLYEGIIKSWKEDKGFGFIQANSRGKDIFIHIRDLRHCNYQPKPGDPICYKLVIDKEGKPRAYDASIKGQEIKPLYRQYLRQTEKLMRQLQGMNIKSMLVLKIVSIASKYKHWIKNCLAFLPSEFLIDNQIINATKIGRPHVRAALLLAKVLIEKSTLIKT